jgi:hypothetical protein
MAALDLKNPGAKEYLIVGGVALGAALLYFWWKGRKGGATAAATDTAGSSAPATPTGLNTSQFFAWIRDHQAPAAKAEPDTDDRKVNRDRDPRDRDDRGKREDHDRDDRKRKAAG